MEPFVQCRRDSLPVWAAAGKRNGPNYKRRSSLAEMMRISVCFPIRTKGLVSSVNFWGCFMPRKSNLLFLVYIISRGGCDHCQRLQTAILLRTVSTTDESARWQVYPAEATNFGNTPCVSSLCNEETQGAPHPADQRKYPARSMSDDAVSQPAGTAIEPARTASRALGVSQETCSWQSTPPNAAGIFEANPFLPACGPTVAPVTGALAEETAPNFAGVRRSSNTCGLMSVNPEPDANAHHTTVVGEFASTSALPDIYTGSFVEPLTNMSFEQTWMTSAFLISNTDAYGNYEARTVYISEWGRQAPGTVWAARPGHPAMLNTSRMQPDPGYFYATCIAPDAEAFAYTGPLQASSDVEMHCISLPSNAVDIGTGASAQLPLSKLPSGAQLWQHSGVFQSPFMSASEAEWVVYCTFRGVSGQDQVLCPRCRTR